LSWASSEARRATNGEKAAGRPVVDRRDLLVLGAFVGLVVLLFRHAWASPAHRWVGDPGDPALVTWFLNWVPRAMLHGHNPLFTHHMNAPDGVNLMWNAATPLPAVLLAPVTLTLGPVVAFNVFSTLALAGSGWTCTLMLRRFVASRWAAVAGGLVYAFSPFMLGHARAGHPHMPFALVPPLMVIVLLDLLVRQRRSFVLSGVVLGLLGFAQLMISSEVLASSFLVAILGVVILMALHPSEVRSRAAHAARGIGVAAVVALGLSAVPLAFQFFGPQHVEGGSIWGPETFVNDALAFVVPAGHEQLSPRWAEDITARYTNACCPAELDGYVGVPLIALALTTAILLWRRGIVRLAALLTAVLALLSLGPHLHVNGRVTSIPMPFTLLSPIPLVHNMFPARLMVHAFLMVSVLVAVAIDAAGHATGRRRSVWLGAVVLALIPLVPRVDFPATDARVPPFFTSSDVRRIPKGSVVLVAPFARDSSTADPLLWQVAADLRYRMPDAYGLGPDRNGRYSFLPIPTTLSTVMEDIQQGRPAPPLTPGLRRAVAADLIHADVGSVVVGPMRYVDAMVAFLTDLLGARPHIVGGVALWLGVDPATLAAAAN
jgi:hypothetical protein